MSDHELSMEDLHTQTSEEVMGAGALDGVIYTDTYHATVRAVTARKNADDAEWDAGRQVANLNVVLTDRETGDEAGTLFIRVSWEPRYTPSGNLDNTARRYTQLAKAVQRGRSSKAIAAATVAEVLSLAQQTAFDVRVNESYNVNEDDLHEDHSGARINGDGTAWVVLKREDVTLREHYIGLGYEPRALVKGIQAIR